MIPFRTNLESFLCPTGSLITAPTLPFPNAPCGLAPSSHPAALSSGTEDAPSELLALEGPFLQALPTHPEGASPQPSTENLQRPPPIHGVPSSLVGEGSAGTGGCGDAGGVMGSLGLRLSRYQRAGGVGVPAKERRELRFWR